MIGAHGAFDDVEGVFIPVRPLAQDLLPANIAAENGVAKVSTSERVLGTTVTKNPCSASIVRKFFSVHSLQSAT